jgi:hypothetical protein
MRTEGENSMLCAFGAHTAGMHSASGECPVCPVHIRCLSDVTGCVWRSTPFVV